MGKNGKVIDIVAIDDGEGRKGDLGEQQKGKKRKYS